MVKGYKVHTFNEALEIINKEDCTILCGGTDLMVKKRRGWGVKPNFEKPVVFIGHLQELKKITLENNTLTIGAGCTCSQMAESIFLPEYIKDSVLCMASPGIRNIATIGGNICNSSPAGDILPVLYALEATLVLYSFTGKRQVPIKEFIIGVGKNTLEKDEILKEIKIEIKNFNKVLHRKVGTRKSIALSKISFVGLAKVEKGKIEDIRLAFGAVAPTVVKSKSIEKEIEKSGSLEEVTINKIKSQYEKLLKPIDDQRSKGIYRKNISLKLLEEFLQEIKEVL